MTIEYGQKILVYVQIQGIRGATISEVAHELGIARDTAARYLARFAQSGRLIAYRKASALVYVHPEGARKQMEIR